MPSSMTWLAIVIRITIAPVLVGALAVLVHSERSSSDVATSMGLLLLGAIHFAYWWDPWQRSLGQSVAAVASMIVINFVLLNLVGLAEPLLWLYPALVAGAGSRTPLAVVATSPPVLRACRRLSWQRASGCRKVLSVTACRRSWASSACAVARRPWTSQGKTAGCKRQTGSWAARDTALIRYRRRD